MNRKLLLGLSLIMLFSSASAHAETDELHHKMMPMTQVLKGLKAKGFEIVRKIQFEDGKYVANIINAQGKEIKIVFNPQDGQIVQPKENVAGLSALEIATKVEKAGYNDIYKMDTTIFGHKYEIDAYDRSGQKIEIEVDANSGKIRKLKAR